MKADGTVQLKWKDNWICFIPPGNDIASLYFEVSAAEFFNINNNIITFMEHLHFAYVS